MPPQATGFRYTPPSYLLRTRGENRPWTSSSEGEDSSLDELEMAMRQEERPARKETTIDQHFQNRVNRRKQAYRRIMKGQVELEQDDKPVDVENVDLHLSDSAINTSEAPSIAAREARQRRLSASTPAAIASGETILSRKEVEQNRMRNLRAQRLRHSLKVSTEEEDAKEALKIRRQKQAEKDRLAAEQEEKARQQEEEARLASERQRQAIEQERRKLEQERRAFELAKRKAAEELERRQELERQQQVAAAAAATRQRSDCSGTSSEITRPRRRVTRQRSLPGTELTLFEEIQEMVREAGVFKVCVSSCFGDEGDMRNQGDMIIPSRRSYRRKENEEF